MTNLITIAGASEQYNMGWPFREQFLWGVRLRIDPTDTRLFRITKRGEVRTRNIDQKMLTVIEWVLCNFCKVMYPNEISEAIESFRNSQDKFYSKPIMMKAHWNKLIQAMCYVIDLNWDVRYCNKTINQISNEHIKPVSLRYVGSFNFDKIVCDVLDEAEVLRAFLSRAADAYEDEVVYGFPQEEIIITYGEVDRLEKNYPGLIDMDLVNECKKETEAKFKPRDEKYIRGFFTSKKVYMERVNNFFDVLPAFMVKNGFSARPTKWLIDSMKYYRHQGLLLSISAKGREHYLKMTMVPKEDYDSKKVGSYYYAYLGNSPLYVEEEKMIKSLFEMIDEYGLVSDASDINNLPVAKKYTEFQKQMPTYAEILKNKIYDVHPPSAIFKRYALSAGIQVKTRPVFAGDEEESSSGYERKQFVEWAFLKNRETRSVRRDLGIDDLTDKDVKLRIKEELKHNKWKHRAAFQKVLADSRSVETDNIYEVLTGDFAEMSQDEVTVIRDNRKAKKKKINVYKDTAPTRALRITRVASYDNYCLDDDRLNMMRRKVKAVGKNYNRYYIMVQNMTLLTSPDSVFTAFSPADYGGRAGLVKKSYRVAKSYGLKSVKLNYLDKDIENIMNCSKQFFFDKTKKYVQLGYGRAMQRLMGSGFTVFQKNIEWKANFVIEKINRKKNEKMKMLERIKNMNIYYDVDFSKHCLKFSEIESFETDIKPHFELKPFHSFIPFPVNKTRSIIDFKDDEDPVLVKNAGDKVIEVVHREVKMLTKRKHVYKSSRFVKGEMIVTILDKITKEKCKVFVMQENLSAITEEYRTLKAKKEKTAVITGRTEGMQAAFDAANRRNAALRAKREKDEAKKSSDMKGV